MINKLKNYLHIKLKLLTISNSSKIARLLKKLYYDLIVFSILFLFRLYLPGQKKKKTNLLTCNIIPVHPLIIYIYTYEYI